MLDPLTLLFQLFLAALLGGVIGFEREGIKRPAGFRTHILVCVGATVAVHTNLQLIASHSATGPMDPARLGAQVISGLGFLGAGTILKEGNTVKGLTTAASLWVVGIIGLAIGAGQYFSAAVSTVILYIILTTFRKIESRIKEKKINATIHVTLKNEEQATYLLSLALSGRDCQVRRLKKTYTSDKITKLKVSLLHPSHISEIDLLSTISELPFVLSASAAYAKDEDPEDTYKLDG